MAMSMAAAYGIYPQDAPLNDIISTLNHAGFGNEEICMLLSPTHPIASIVREASVFDADRESSAVTAGLIGWLSNFGAVVIPTVGFFIRSQVFFHALMVAREAPALCGNARTLVGLGFAESEAEKFENRLRQLGVLVYVSCAETARIFWAREILQHTGAQEVATLSEPGREESTLDEKMSATAAA